MPTSPALDKDTILELSARCLRSPVEYGRVFFPDWFPTKMPWVHRGILAILRGRTDFLLDFGSEVWRDELAEWTLADLEKILTNFVEEETLEDGSILLRPIFALIELDGEPRVIMNLKENVAVMMPRGFSKTTLLNLSNLHDICYKNEDFFLYASETGPHAERQLGTVKFELEDNDPLRLVFGDLVSGRQSPLKWTDNFIETQNEVMVGAVGTGGQIRGYSKRAKRPGKVVYDDLQNTDSYRSETQRNVDKNWFFQTALPIVRKGGRSIILGTLLGSEAIMAHAMKHPDFTSIRFGAIDRQGEPLWSYMMSLAEIEHKKQAMASVGELSGFYLEYMSEARTDESRMFPSNKLIYINKPFESIVGLALAEDPAISDSANAAFCAFAVVGIEKTGHKHVIDYFGQKGMDPAAQVDKFFELHSRHMILVPPEFRKYGVEAIGYQRALIHLLQGEMYRRSAELGMNAYFEITPIIHGKVGKLPRVQGILKPLIWSGYLTFESRWPALETQFLEWPTGLLDGPDVVAMAITLLDPFASLNLPSDAPDLTADYYEPITLIGGCP